ncbi:hypothetical protein GCM10009808_10450 [Microbacterium sediminicola]|uniref:SCP2 domain-containing protein n=1 Tax=Microbacterium sediminicola TaxID=415210 RepID=A0ABP4TYC2_9MICO
MLTEIDERVHASVNLHAVFGALPRLVELVPAARALTESLDRPVALTFVAAGVGRMTLGFTSGAVIEGATTDAGNVRLLFRSPAHLNAVIAGTAQPIPFAGPRGLKFLTGVFAPMADLLGRYLQPSAADLEDPVFVEAHNLLSLHVAATAITVIANEDHAGKFSAAQMADGDLDIAVGDDLSYRIRVADHRLSLVPASAQPARAVFSFADLATAGDVLGGRESALACVCDGRIAMRGYIPLVDNTSRILDRVGQYLGK